MEVINILNCFFENSPNSETYFCGFSSDTVENTIYILPKDSVSEYLFFDFDSIINVGEQFEMTYFNGDNWGKGSPYLQYIDSIMIEVVYYQNWNFGDFEITERIMSASGLPFHGLILEMIGHYALELKCYYEENQSVYGTICPFTSEISNMSNEIFENELDFEIYPNPFNEFIQINNAQNSQLIDVSEFESGVYLFEIGDSSKRVIKL